MLLLGFTASIFASAAVYGCADDDESKPSADAGATQADGTTSSDANAGDTGNGDATTANDSASDADLASNDGGLPQTLTGPFALVHHGVLSTIDMQSASVRYDDAGALAQWVANPQFKLERTTAKAFDTYSDPFAHAVRWGKGDVNIVLGGSAGVFELEQETGEHAAVARVPYVPPASGSATYQMVHATQTTPGVAPRDAGLGTVTSGQLRVEWGGVAGTRVAFTIAVSMGDGTYEMRGNGGFDAPTDGGASFVKGDGGFVFVESKSVTSGDGGHCGGGTCQSSSSYITFAGANGERALLTYKFNSGAAANARGGVVVFAKQ